MDDPAPPTPNKIEPDLRLRILETTDLHVHIMPHDYMSDRPQPNRGLALTANLIHAARAQADNTLLFDNGDFLQGNPLADWAISKDGPANHPMIAAMNSLGYDAACLGNHEFNYGLDVLQTALSQATFPLTCANVLTSRGPTPAKDTHLITPWLILTRDVQATDGTQHRLRIGVIGLAPPQIPNWDHFALGDRIKTRDIVETAAAHIPDIQAAGADIIVALCHAGIGSRTHRPGMENAAVPLAALDGIDVVLAGHTHEVFPDPAGTSNDAVDHQNGTLHGKPSVQAGCLGSHLGQIDLALQRSPAGWHITRHTTRLVPVVSHDQTPDPTIAALTAPAHRAVLSRIRQPVATTSAPLHGHFARVAPSTALTLLADALRGAAQACLKDTAQAALPLIIAVQPHSSIRGGGNSGLDTPAGQLLVHHASELYPYPNEPCLLQADGKTLRLWLENAARGFLRIKSGKQNQPLINPGIPGYQVDVLFGLRYQIDVSQPAGRRVKDIRLADGRPLKDTDHTAVVTTTYRAGGGGGYGMARDCPIIAVGKHSIGNVIVDYLKTQRTVHPRAERVWSFAPVAQATAWFEANAAAMDHISTLTEPRITPEPAIDPKSGSDIQRFRYDLDG